MKLPILASIIIFISLLLGLIKRSSKSAEKIEKAFWEKERASNEVRRKPLDNLDYILLPMDLLPLHTMEDNEKVQEYISIIQALSTRKIVNFTGITNTDLKLTYGTANITALSEYDENYTTLITTLQRWAQLLYDGNFLDDAQNILEYAVSIGSDVSASYYLLADIYQIKGEPNKISQLRDTAVSLPGKIGQTIVHALQESYL